MEIQILVSQKGTRVITATNLFGALGFADHHYAGYLKKWLNDVYAFHDGIRKPKALTDFAKRQIKGNGVLKDFYFSLEFSKLITLHSNSKFKLKVAKYLDHKAEQFKHDDMLHTEDVITAIEVAKLLQHIPYQKICEREHLALYEKRNGGSAANWWRHREQVLGISIAEVRQKATTLDIAIEKHSIRHLLLQYDPFELIRIATIDLFLALDKNVHYAQKMGDLTKAMAKKLQLQITKHSPELDKVKPMINTSLLKPFWKSHQQQPIAKRA